MSCSFTSEGNGILLLRVEVLNSKIFIPKENIIVNGDDIRMEKPFRKPPESTNQILFHYKKSQTHKILY